MTEHYYTANPTSAHKEQSFTATLLGNALTFVTDSGVFSRDGVDAGTKLLLETLPEADNRKFLDLACGWGAVGIAVAKRYPTATVTMTDINARAASLARRNAEANGVQAEILCGDGLCGLPSDFGLIAVNPPIRAGKAVIYRLFAECAEHLSANGALYVVIRKQQGAPSALKYLSCLFRGAEVVGRGGGYWVLGCFSPLENAAKIPKSPVDNLSVDNSGNS